MRHVALLACLGLVLPFSACGDDPAPEVGGYPDVRQSEGDATDIAETASAEPSPATVDVSQCPTELGLDQTEIIATPADEAAWVAPWLLTATESPAGDGRDVLSLITGNYPITVLTVEEVDELAAGTDAFFALYEGGTQLGSENDQQLSRIETDGTVTWTVSIPDAITQAGLQAYEDAGYSLSVTESAAQLTVSLREGSAFLAFDTETGETSTIAEPAQVTPAFSGIASFGYGPDLSVFGNAEEPVAAQGFEITSGYKVVNGRGGSVIDGKGASGETWRVDADASVFTCGDVLYAATGDSQLYVLDPTTGEQLQGPVDYSGHDLATGYFPIMGVTPDGVFAWRRGSDDYPDEILLISAE